MRYKVRAKRGTIRFPIKGIIITEELREMELDEGFAEYLAKSHDVELLPVRRRKREPEGEVQ